MRTRTESNISFGHAAANVLELDDEGIDSLTLRLFESLTSFNTTENKDITKEAMRHFTVNMLEHLNPDAPFDEEAFEVGFKQLDKNADGLLEYDELKVHVK